MTKLYKFLKEFSIVFRKIFTYFPIYWNSIKNTELFQNHFRN